ncbi:collagen alpha-6(VI) chain [Trichomycterus rosablanca]|uniref:collagen alpha-6(VI) chain n=1 Tax=Trichomycterus rosablanca TaxID=2290929 RepID=UPI002F35BABC
MGIIKGLLLLFITASCFSVTGAETVGCNASLADIVFFVDSSSDIGDANFQMVKQFLHKFITGFNVNSNKVKVGLAQFSNNSHKELLLGQYASKTDLLGKVDKLTFLKRDTKPAKSLPLILRNHFTQAGGSRVSEKVPQIAVVVTNEGTSFDMLDVENATNELQGMGVLIFTIGVGAVNITQLQSIANQPYHRFLLTYTDYQELVKATDSLVYRVCTYLEAQLQALAPKVSDVFVLVDSNVNQTQELTQFLTHLTTKFKVGFSSNRIALAQFGEDVSMEIRFDAYKTETEALTHIEQFRLRGTGQRKLGKAMDYVRQYLTQSAVSRRSSQSYKQYLVVVGTGKSDDKTFRAIRDLKREKVTIVNVDLSKKAEGMDFEFRETLLSAPQVPKVYPTSLARPFGPGAPYFPDPPKIFDQGETLYPSSRNAVQLVEDVEAVVLSEDVINVIGDCRLSPLADVVFIVDVSESAPALRDFLYNVIAGFEIGSDKVQVGLVLYSDTPTAEIYLNTFTNKQEVLNHIKLMPFLAGNPYTGRALKFAREKVFTKEKGSRRDRGVRQIAVVITMQQSLDVVTTEAYELQASGVEVYAIGNNDLQLKQIVSFPETQHMFIMEDFNNLFKMEDILRTTLCSSVVHSTAVRSSGFNLKQGCTQTEKADIYFLLGFSSSNNNKFLEVKDFIKKFMQMFAIGPKRVRVGVVQYSDIPKLEFDLAESTVITSLEKTVDSIRLKYGTANIGKALHFMSKQFDDADKTRDSDTQKILILLTDGESQDEVKEPAGELRAKGVTIYTIGMDNANDKQLLKITDDPGKTFFVTNLDKLQPIKNEIATDVCSDHACKNILADIIFLMDGSDTISSDNFKKIKEFMNSMVFKSRMCNESVQFGVIQYSSHPQIEFPLNKFKQRSEIVEAIDNIQQLQEEISTGLALQYAINYFDSSEGARLGAKKVLIVITNGMSNDDVAQPSKALRDKGITIYSVGIGEVDSTQLREISGSQDNTFLSINYDELQFLQKKLSLKVYSSAQDCQKIQSADIVFLVDGSTSIVEQDFKKVKSFMNALVDSTNVGPSAVCFCTILYSDIEETKANFTLNQYKSKGEVMTAISQLDQPTGDTYTAEAILYSLEYFGQAKGGRRANGVPQILIVITDGEATNPYGLPKAAEEIHKLGVTVYGIGVGKAKQDELLTITRDINKVYNVTNYSALEALLKTFSKVICTESKPECTDGKADLVILMDGSENIKEASWKTMENFMLNLVSNLRIRKDLYQIGVAQFGYTYKKEFYLKHNETDVKTAIKAITKIKEESRSEGTQVRIGNALTQVQEFFQVSKGSRAGVSKMLLLITASQSADSVTAAAKNLRAMGIQISVIGIGDVLISEINDISREPRRTFTYGFNSLALNQTTQVVIKSLCTQYPAEMKDCTVDIAVGFDITRISSQLIFGSQYKLQEYLRDIMQKISKLPNLCCRTERLTEHQNNIGFRVVASDGTLLYDTNFETISDDIMNKIMNLRITQALAFNSQLLQSFMNKLKASNAGVKVVIIFTDGLNAHTGELKRASDDLKESGVHALLTVALEGVQSTAELQKLEFGRGFDYKEPLTIGMRSVASTMQRQLDNVVSRECCNVMCKCAGHEGQQGHRGFSGPKGSRGQKGHPGFPGNEGGSGGRGLPGLNGTQGHLGCHGKRGPKGVRGYRGDQGEEGEDGLDGINGELGVTGLGGSLGERGDPGSLGKKGPRGIPGVPGQKGLRGDPGEPGTENNIRGPKGEIGYPGLQGDAGPDGNPGSSGENGKPGQKGRRGPAGSPGAVGPPGEPGLQGIPGATGPMGKIGPSGGPGQKGITGLPGAQGPPGRVGNPGSKGNIGSRGQKGQSGDPGVKGAAGPPGLRGAPGNDGPDGFGLPGLNGQKGDPGFPGYPGLEGEIGDTGKNGDPGPKGTTGRGGSASRAGAPGIPGNNGPPGPRGAKGPPGTRDMSTCQLISYVRDNCVCCKDKEACPAYPTELVIGLDMSVDVRPLQFESMKSALYSLLDNLNIAESNCPTGARVSVVSYSNITKYIIRFSDHPNKKQLMEAVKNIALERTSNQRNLGAAMRFVGRNVFKRVRQGVLMRKVAIFLNGEESKDDTSMTTAILEYKALDIHLGVLAFNNTPTPKIRRAFEAIDAQRFVLSVVRRQQNPSVALRRINQCVICFDYCNPATDCFTTAKSVPLEVDLDLAVLVDGSRSILADEYEGVKQVLGTVLDQLEVSRQPSNADKQARVALYQQSSSYSEAQAPVKQIFNFQQFHNRNLMKQSIFQNLQQTGGSSRLGLAIEFIIMQGLLTVPKPRKNKMVLLFIGDQTEHFDLAKLDSISKIAKCQGVVLFILTVGDQFNSTQVEELASLPTDQHIVHLGHVKQGEQEYAQRFLNTFLHILSRGMNTYPAPSLKQQCENSQQGQGQSKFPYVYEAAERAPIDRTSLQTAEDTKITHTWVKTESENGGQLSSRYQYSNDAAEITNTKGATQEETNICLLKHEQGPCGNYKFKWYYNREHGECSPFWYGGCHGNSNRFDTQEECKALCVRHRTLQ